MQGMIGNSTHSTWDACYISCASSGRTKCQTQKSKNVPMGMACTSSFANPGPISKDLLYGELVEDSRLTGCPCLCYKDVCKRDLKACNINTDMWETSAEDLSTWCRRGIHEAEKTRTEHLIKKRCGRKNFVSSLGTRLFLQATPVSGSAIRMLDSTPTRKDAKKNSTDTTPSSFRDRQMTTTTQTKKAKETSWKQGLFL